MRITLGKLFKIIAGIFGFTFVVLVMLVVTFWRGSTEYGSCIGLEFLGSERVDSLVYTPNVPNIIIGAVGVHTVVAPIMVAFTSTHCPTGIKKNNSNGT